jgi:hypothetical protein
LTRGGLLNALASLNAVADRGTWTAATDYHVHDLVEYGNTTWVCATAHTSGATFDETKFTELDKFRGAWAATTRYTTGDIVVNAGVLYSANTTFTSGASFSGTNWIPLSGGSGAVQGSVGTNLGAAVTVDFASAVKKIILVGTLNANCTVTLANRVAGCEAVLLLTQDATGGRTLTLSDGTNTDPVTIASAATALSVVEVECPDATNVNWVVVGGSGFANPMTTLGDLIVGGASGAATRLAKGADGTFLGVQSGTVGFYTPSGGTNVADRGAWATSTAYAVHDLVEYGGTTWLCATAHTSGATFDETKFTELDQFRGAWQATTRYKTGDVVYNGTTLYSANSTFTSGGSFNATNWTVIGGAGSGLSPSAQVFTANGTYTIPAGATQLEIITVGAGGGGGGAGSNGVGTSGGGGGGSGATVMQTLAVSTDTSFAIVVGAGGAGGAGSGSVGTAGSPGAASTATGNNTSRVVTGPGGQSGAGGPASNASAAGGLPGMGALANGRSATTGTSGQLPGVGGNGNGNVAGNGGAPLGYAGGGGGGGGQVASSLGGNGGGAGSISSFGATGSGNTGTTSGGNGTSAAANSAAGGGGGGGAFGATGGTGGNGGSGQVIVKVVG